MSLLLALSREGENRSYRRFTIILIPPQPRPPSCNVKVRNAEWNLRDIRTE